MCRTELNMRTMSLGMQLNFHCSVTKLKHHRFNEQTFLKHTDFQKTDDPVRSRKIKPKIKKKRSMQCATRQNSFNTHNWNEWSVSRNTRLQLICTHFNNCCWFETEHFVHSSHEEKVKCFSCAPKSLWMDNMWIWEHLSRFTFKNKFFLFCPFFHFYLVFIFCTGRKEERNMCNKNIVLWT